MKTWWHFRGGQMTTPYMVAVTRAEDVRAAVEVFGEEWPCAFVRELSSPLVLALPEVQAVQPGAVEMIYVDELPSYYDRFKTADGRWDYEDVEDADVEPR